MPTPNISRWTENHGAGRQARRQQLQDQLDPTSDYWHTQAYIAAQEFINRIGSPAYQRWCDDNLSDDTSSLVDWRDTHHKIEAALKQVVGNGLDDLGPCSKDTAE